MQLILQLAIRNLWRQRRRNGLVLLAIVLTISGVFVMNTLARGMEYSFLEDSIRHLRGHIKIESLQYADEPSAKHRIPAMLMQEAGELPAIVAMSPRLRIPSVIMSERETRGATLVGIDPATEKHSFVEDIVVEGDWLQGQVDDQILIGRKLAEDLKTSLGRRLVLIFEGTGEDTIEIGVKVQGIFDAGSDGIESGFIFTSLPSLQRVLETDELSEISLYLQAEPLVSATVLELKDRLPGFAVYSWQEMDPFVGQMYEYIGFSIYLLIVIFMFSLVFGLVNALVTAVLERSREFGLLRAVGLNTRMVVVQVVIECVVIMLLGLVLGITVGLGFYFWLEDGIDLSNYASGIEAFGMATKMVPRLVVEDFVIIGIASFILGLIASYFPAKRVIKTSILDAIRG